jgi:tetratricopeptide (TPR) repeat protein
MLFSSHTSRALSLVLLCFFTREACLSQATERTSELSQLQTAANELSAGKLDQAERDLDSVLASSPEDYRALDLLGVVRVLQHRQADAETLFERVVKTKSDFAPGHAHLGLLYLQLGRTQDAVPELIEALQLDRTRTDVASALAHILQDEAKAASASGGWDKALNLLIEARKYAPDNPDVEYEFGVAAQKLSLYDDAIEAFQRTLKVRKDDALAMYYLGFALMDRARYDDALQQFARYIELRPEDPAGHGAMGMALAGLGRSEEARSQFERSIALAPALGESYYRLGLLDLDAGDYDRATQDLHAALEHKPNDAGVLVALGKVEFEQKHYPEAITLLQQVISQDDSAQEAHYYLGLTLARMGRKEESSEQLEISARLEQQRKERGRHLLRLNKSDDLEQKEPAAPQ